MTVVDITRVKSFYANGKEHSSYDILVGDDTRKHIDGLSREDLIELYHSIARFFKEVEKEELE